MIFTQMGKKTHNLYERELGMKPMTIATAVILMLTFTACAPVESVPAQPPGTPVKLSSQDVKTVEAGVRAVMIDPDSARFGTMVAVEDSTGKITVCGYVNGRNRLGGYTGNKPFMGNFINEGGRKSFGITGFGSTESNDMAVSIMCKRRGISI